MYKMENIRTILCLLVLHHSVSSLKLTGPSVHTARLGSDARVPCLVTVDNPPVDPEHITILWLHQDKEILSYDKSVRTTSPRYSLSTEALGAGTGDLTITNIQIPDGGMYKCSVTYRSHTKEKEIRLDVGAPPQVTVTGNTVVMNKESVLSCSITGFYPIDIDVRWFKGTELLRNVTMDEPQRNPDRTYNGTSTLTITPTEEDRERNFSCTVHHFSLDEPLQVDFQLVYREENRAMLILLVCITTVVLVTTVIVIIVRRRHHKKADPKLSHPVMRCLSAPGEIKYLLNLKEFYPKSIKIVWTCGVVRTEEDVLSPTNSLSQNPDRTYNVSSKVTIPEERHKDPGFRVRVTWDHGSMEKPESRELTMRDPDYRWKPKVEKIQIPKYLRHDSPATLRCNISGYFPDAVTVRWMRRENKKSHEETGTAVTTTTRSANNTYNCTTSLTITPTWWPRSEYICQVDHPSLENPILISTEKLQVTPR
ncbi:programmed cell death 1 ligand 1-like isoform X2 [Dendropsophus ebraccatus]|uniref:programmed cell death 1 ligand 1-like isoform X2 n=1 Tax=Dendropsophus ebraccatus TaxID=150705 RepID=UPI0038315216